MGNVPEKGDGVEDASGVITAVKDFNEVGQLLGVPVRESDLRAASVRVDRSAAEAEVIELMREPSSALVANSYYNNAAKEFLIPNQCGGRTRANSFEARAFLQPDDIREVMLSRPVSYAGPLAGHKAGFIQDKSLLITSSPPKAIQPKQGGWDKIRTLAASLFVRMRGRKAYNPEDIDLTAFNHLLAWIFFGYEHTSGGVYTPGQLLVMAGPAGCGKSAFQDRVITPLFGGRSADIFLSFGAG